MKRIHYILLMLCACVMASCIEEYDELPGGQAEPMMVVDGQIVSNSDCTFSLRWSSPLGMDNYASFMPISKALVTVEGTDGQRFVGQEQDADNPGHYIVPVGELKADAEYYVSIKVPAKGSYISRPMRPLDAPDIAEVAYEQPRDDRMINFMVTTSDPQGPVCLLWEYDETWEIFTPYIAYWEYLYEEFEGEDPLHLDYKGDFYQISMDRLTNHGWCTFAGQESVIATNEDYGQGAIRKLSLYQRHPDDLRFQTRYLTRIRQMAISQQEYEYRHLLATQSTQMGGLFTPMPSELPSNIIAADDAPPAIGFVGVRGKVCEESLYVDRQEVGHHDRYKVDFVPDSLVEDPRTMLKSGYRVIVYDPYSGDVKWSDRWVIDCTDYFWGAKLERPAYWRDDKPLSF